MLGKIKNLGFSLFPVALLFDFHFFDDVNVLLHAEQGNDFHQYVFPHVASKHLTLRMTCHILSS